jgi:hypothetical protein
MGDDEKPEISKQLSDLAFLALDHGVRSVEDGTGPLVLDVPIVGMLAQRYRGNTDVQDFQGIGNAMLLGDCETRLR